MKCPRLVELPDAPLGRTGWPWTEETLSMSNQSGLQVSWPRVTLVTPSFNQGQYLEEAIRSVLLQGYPDLEYFIMDGGSADDTVRIIKKYEKWITGWCSEPDRGQSHAINKGLSLATGRFCNWHNADDVLTKGSLLATARALTDYPVASAVTGYILTINGNSKELSRNDGHPNLKGREGFLHDARECFAYVKTGCQPGSLMRRDLVVEVGGVDENIHYCMDVDLMLQLMVKGPAYHVDYPVVMFRVHGDSKTTAMKGSRATERLIIVRKLYSRKDLPYDIAMTRHMAFSSAHLCASRYLYDWNVYSRALYHTLMGWIHLGLYFVMGEGDRFIRR